MRMGPIGRYAPERRTGSHLDPSFRTRPSLSIGSRHGGQYKAKSGSPIASGTWAFSDGSGGPDVGPLSFNFPVPPPVTWTNQSTISGSAIDRTQPLTITWSGGDSNGYVDIQGFSQVFSVLSGQYIVGFQCSAPESAGQFTIPPSILLGMPGGNVFGNIQVSTVRFQTSWAMSQASPHPSQRPNSRRRYRWFSSS